MQRRLTRRFRNQQELPVIQPVGLQHAPRTQRNSQHLAHLHQMPLPQRQGDRFDRIRRGQRGRRTHNGCRRARLIHARGGACGRTCGRTCGRAHHVGRRGSRSGRCRHDHVSGGRDLLTVRTGGTSRCVKLLAQLLLSLGSSQQRGTSVNRRPGTRRRRFHVRMDVRRSILLRAILRIPPGSHTHGRHTFCRCR